MMETQAQSINISGLSQGLYTVKTIDFDGGVSIHKLIVR